MSENSQQRFEKARPLATGRGACFATNMITVDGQEIGYMYRAEPRHETDSGWVFTAGIEPQDYMDDPDNTGIHDVNTIADLDPGIIPYLDAPFGSAYSRNQETGDFEEDEFAPLDAAADDSPTAITADGSIRIGTADSEFSTEAPISRATCT